MICDRTMDVEELTRAHSEIPSGYVSQELYTEHLNNLLSLIGTQSLILALILMKLVISSCCKAILKSKSINVKSLYFYDVISFAVLLVMVMNTNSLASNTSHNIFVQIFEVFLFGFPAIITFFELDKKKKKKDN